MKRKTMQVTLASAEPETVDPAAARVSIREAGQTLQTCIAGLEDCLEEPLKSKFSEIKGSINKMLAGLPETDKAPAALELNYMLKQLLGMMANTQSVLTALSEAARSARGELASTRASMTEEVNKAINAKVESGELIAKDDMDKKLSDAVATATKTAREAAASELKVVSDRRLTLTTASIPVPADEVLAAQDFDARKDTASKRVEELKPFGLTDERVLTLAWNTDEAGYANALGLMKEVQAKVAQTAKPVAPTTAPNPFLKRTGSETPLVTRMGVC